jgi:hypothetical protein
MESYTIIDEGAVFSRAQTNPRRDALIALREKLRASLAGLPADDVLAVRLAGKSETLLAVFDELLNQRHAFELVERGATEQLDRASSRWNELPDTPPGRWQALDRLRQNIFMEKQAVLRELRTARLQHVKELARVREQLLEAYNAFCSTARLLPAEAAVRLPTLDEILDFVPRTLIGGEITIPSTPGFRKAPEVRLP